MGVPDKQHALFFREDLQSCREFTIEDWHTLSSGERVRNSLLPLFSRVL